MYKYLVAWAFAVSAGAFTTSFFNLFGAGSWQHLGFVFGVVFFIIAIWMGRDVEREERRLRRQEVQRHKEVLDKLDKIAIILEKKEV